jgi:hypothetical protein
MRSAKESESFPYAAKTVCYIALDAFGQISQIDHGFSSVCNAY